MGGREPGLGQYSRIFAERYFPIEQYRPGNRLQLDSRTSALLGAAAGYKKSGVFILRISKPCGDASPTRAWAANRPADENLAAGPTALFGARASLSVDRGDGRHFTCLRYPCARLTQESSAI